MAVWSNHFNGPFHFDDIPTIVENPSLPQLASIPRFFSNPRISSRDKDSAAYHPLLSAWFAVNYKVGNAKPYIFQAENSLWLLAEMVVIFALFRLIPGVNGFAAAFAALLFGVHPLTAATVNYAMQQGVIVGTFAVTCGMLIWVGWPWHLPQTLPLKLKRVPQHGRDEYLRKNFKRLDARYLKIIHAPIGLYLWPVVPALLIEPATAVFAPILLVYVILFETRRKLRHVIPAGVICGGYWIFQLVFTWKLGDLSKTPLLNYWLTQPWVTVRYLFKFFAPFNLSVDTGLTPFAHFRDPLAVAGYVGLTTLVILAVITSRHTRWRAVSFGIWWFLLALLPDAIRPQRVVEAQWRMFLPAVGLALVVAALASIALERVEESRRVMQFSIAGGLATVLLVLAGWATYQRNDVWGSEQTLWRDALDKNPHDGRAFMYYGLTRLESGDSSGAFDNVSRAAVLTPHDPMVAINLARTDAKLGRYTDAESQFRRAIADGASYSPAFSSYSQWLLDQSRNREAFDMASKAITLDPYDMDGRRALMDILAQGHEWEQLKKFADETFRLFPGSPDAQRSLNVAQAGLDQIPRAEAAATTEPTVNKYLQLSVLYFQAQRYDDCINTARQALKINPNLPEAWANIASAYHTLGKLDDTIAALREEIRLNPNMPSAQKNLGIELTAKAQQSAGH
ncbi:MAG TPA: tetratricopeptide repeat protein [Bryobacteraceae bacterium]|jgi:tetratricopeptide (TPR) repeat protein|nr:tetratricopeptide repeat protein [Bryobacteraceae bacterium]